MATESRPRHRVLCHRSVGRPARAGQVTTIEDCRHARFLGLASASLAFVRAVIRARARVENVRRATNRDRDLESTMTGAAMGDADLGAMSVRSAVYT